MSLKASYPNEADVPADLKSLYKHEGSEWILDVEGMVPQAKLDEFRDNNRRLARERDEQLKPSLKAFQDIGTVEDFQHLKSISDQLDEAKLIRSNKLEEAVEKRVSAMRSEFEKRVEKEQTAAKDLTAQLEVMKIDNVATQEAMKLGARPSALPDIVARIRNRFKYEEGKVVGYKADGTGREYSPKTGDGITINEVLNELTSSAPHLWEDNRGLQTEPGKQTAAPRPGVFSGPNPWKKETHNLTQRMKIAKENPELAKRLRAEAGVVEVGTA